MATCYIGIGSNIGDRKLYIDRAIESLRRTSGVTVKQVSSIYETDPVSDLPQGRFLNGVIEVEAEVSARELLSRLLAIENALGRIRREKNGPRTIDLDILYYGDAVIAEDGLTVPHPRIAEREFVLRGLRELGKI